MSILPPALVTMIEALQTLPGVGQRSAERYAYHLLRTDPSRSNKLAKALTDLHDNIHTCPVTFALIDKQEEISSLYTDPRRTKQVIAVVEDAFDIVALESTGHFEGTYHVLGGLISPIDGIDPASLHIPDLVARAKKDKATEIILAISSTVEGESTAHYIKSQLDSSKCLVTRLARGIPIGLDIEYTDQLTLGRALEGRQAV